MRTRSDSGFSSDKLHRLRLSFGLPAALIALAVLTAGTFALAEDGSSSGIGSVSLSKPFFDPADGQTIDLLFQIRAAGRLSVILIDRDGYPVRRLTSEEGVPSGPRRLVWDGRDDNGEIVPDEAYSIWATLRTSAGVSKYAPAETPSAHVEAKPGYYDRATGIFRYELAAPARVHLQSGTAKLEKSTRKKDGPVLKTLVNRVPRPAGPVVETWNGLDETGSFFVPDLPDFVMAVAATSLPENALITVGNRQRSFLETVATRSGAPLVTPSSAPHQHHAGLTSLEDVSPALRFHLDNAAYSADTRAWKTEGGRLTGSLNLEGPSSAAFAAEPATLYVFVDGRRVQSRPASHGDTRFDVAPSGLPAGPHIVAFNWVSDYGPVAVTAFQLETGSSKGHSGVGK